MNELTIRAKDYLKENFASPPKETGDYSYDPLLWNSINLLREAGKIEINPLEESYEKMCIYMFDQDLEASALQFLMDEYDRGGTSPSSLVDAALEVVNTNERSREGKTSYDYD